MRTAALASYPHAQCQSGKRNCLPFHSPLTMNLGPDDGGGGRVTVDGGRSSSSSQGLDGEYGEGDLWFIDRDSCLMYCPEDVMAGSSLM